MSFSEPALSDMEMIVNPNDEYDYTSYITQDSKTLASSSKLLLLSIFLIRLIDRYQQPTYKSQSSAQTEFENNELHSKFVEFKATVRSKFLTISRVLHENHMIICQLILQKVSQ